MEASAYGDFGACSQPGGFQYSPLRPAFPAAGPPCPALGSSNCALGALRDHQPAPYSAGERRPGPTLPPNLAEPLPLPHRTSEWHGHPHMTWPDPTKPLKPLAPLGDAKFPLAGMNPTLLYLPLLSGPARSLFHPLWSKETDHRPSLLHPIRPSPAHSQRLTVPGVSSRPYVRDPAANPLWPLDSPDRNLL